MKADAVETGSLARLIDQLDERSPLGPRSSWSTALRNAVSLILPARAEIVLFWGPDYCALYNDAYAPTIGDKHPHALGRPAREGWRELWEDLEPMLQSVRRSGETIFAKDRPFYIERDGGKGEEVFFDISYSAVPEEDGSVGGVLCIVAETTDRVRAQRQAQAERDRLWTLSRDPFLVANRDGIWLSVSPAWTALLGWTEAELVGRTSEWMEHPDDRTRTRAEIRQLADGGVTIRFENRFRTRAGGYRWFTWTAVPDGDLVYCTARDTTAEKEAAEALRGAEDALRQAQKMETVGQLTGGVAHDFNNLLQVVIGNLDILNRHLPQAAARLRRATESAITGAQRAATLTQRLLAFSRRQPLAPSRIDPNRLVAGMSELLHRTLGETVMVETRLDPGAWPVEVDANQLENAILNLAVNARDAMPEGGTLVVETANTHLDRLYAARNADVSPGQYVVIAVSDSGTGMDAETVGRAFEPFYTTKEVGRGTGLGLSMVYGFIKQSNGHVKIESEPGSGTSIRIYLPRHHGAAVEEISAPEVVPHGPASGTVLVVEDDDAVRAYSVEMLQELGYTVLEAPDGPEALRLLEERPTGIDLLFTDVVLPGGMTGAAVAERAAAMRPGLKVLFTTGYARDAIVHGGRIDPGVELITKPFTYAGLAARIRGLLDT